MMGEPKKYGLIIPTKKQTRKPVKKLSVFGDDSSDDEGAHKEVNVSLLQEAQKKKQMKQTQIEIQKALKQDPSVYEYDAVYDQMEEKKKVATAKLPEKDKKPKYIQNLLKFAAARKREYERSVERQVQKEREQEQGEFDDKEAFVTEAFRQKMQEQAEEEERIRRQDAIDAANDVTKQEDLSLFYRNLLNRNVSLGGSFAADTTKSDVMGTDDDKNKSESDSLGNNENKESKDSERAKENLDKEKRREDSGRRSPRGSEKTSGGNEGRKHESRRHTKSPDRYRRHHDHRNRRHSNSDSDEGRKRHSSDSHRRDRRRETGGEEGKGRHRESYHSERRLSSHERDRRHSELPEPERTSHDDRMGVDRKRDHRGDRNREDKNVRENESKEPQTAEEQTKQIPREETKTKFAKRSTNETVMSAKERYLARKRARDAAMVTAQNNDSDED